MSKRAAATFSLPLGALSGSVAKRPRLISPVAAPGSASISETTSHSLAHSTARTGETIAGPSKSASTFDVEAYTASLSTKPSPGSGLSERELLALEVATIDPSWLELLQDEIRKPYFIKLKEALWKEGVRGVHGKGNKTNVFPPAHDIYSWSRHTPVHRVRVVGIGQDPYHGKGQAHGLAFSVRPGVKVPPSLRNIYKEIAEEYPGFTAPKHGNLISWADSGVLLLNTSLTVKEGQAGAHSKLGWEDFTDKLLQLVDQYGGSGEVGKEGTGVVFLAWGAWASKRVAKLDKSKHLVLESAHPSPLSARRGFFGNGHFKAANEWLKTRYGETAQIAWTELDENAGESAAVLESLERKEAEVKGVEGDDA